MIVLMGTHSLAQTTIILPNPGWNNDKNINQKVKWGQAMDGTVYSYVEGTQERALRLDFLLTEGKGEELMRFFKVYATTLNRMYDHNNDIWTFKFVNDNLALTTQFASEMKQVTLDLLGTKL